MIGTIAKARQFYQRNLGLGEDAPNSNWITSWYGMTGPWCAMTVSRMLVESGWSDDGDTITFPSRTTTRKGWAYCPYMLRDLRDAGMQVRDPVEGAIVLHTWYASPTEPDHVGWVDEVLADGTYWSYEGNQADELRRVRRDRSTVAGFFLPPYAGEPKPEPQEDSMFSKSSVATRHLVAAHSGLLLTATGKTHGTGVIQAEADGTLSQRWELWGHEDGTVSFVNRWGNLALDRPDNTLEPGTHLQVAGVEFNPAQRWAVDSFAGMTHVWAPGSNAAMDVDGAHMDEAPVILWPGHMNLNQLWMLAHTI